MSTNDGQLVNNNSMINNVISYNGLKYIYWTTPCKKCIYLHYPIRKKVSFTFFYEKQMHFQVPRGWKKGNWTEIPVRPEECRIFVWRMKIYSVSTAVVCHFPQRFYSKRKQIDAASKSAKHRSKNSPKSVSELL